MSEAGDTEPFTFERLLSMATECAKTGKGQIMDIVNKKMHEMAPEELEKLFNPEGFCSTYEYGILRKGLELWMPRNRYGKFSDEQLKAMAKTRLTALQYDIPFEQMTESERYLILKTHNEVRKRINSDKGTRDASPERNYPTRTRIDKRYQSFAKTGPYTFAGIKNLAIRCAAARSMQVADILNEKMHKFPPRELAKIFNAQKYCNPKEYRLWLLGLDVVQPANLYGKLSDAQLKGLAETPLENWNFDINFAEMRPKERLKILKVHNDVKRRLYAEKHQ
jgi:hypothetical protein